VEGRNDVRAVLSRNYCSSLTKSVSLAGELAAGTDKCLNSRDPVFDRVDFGRSADDLAEGARNVSCTGQE
jgi:hypothetical protein